MTTQLGLLVVLPILVAQFVRRRKAVAETATRRKAELGGLAQCGILFMVFLGAIKTGLRLNSGSGSIALLDAMAMLTAVVVLHASMLWLGIATARLLGFSREDQIAVGFSGSQKTLMVGLLMAITLKASILPMVAYHCLQLFVDTLVADAYRRSAKGASGAVGSEAAN
jgi:sodium/bile acid cotransporter 7